MMNIRTILPKFYEELENKSLTPSLIDVLFCHLLQTYFSDSDNIQFDGLKNKIWTNDPDTTNIRIEPVYKWTPTLVDRCPAIIVRRGELKQQTIGMFAGTQPYQQGKSVESYKIWFGTHSCVCLSTVAAEADLLGYEVAKLFADYKRQILQYFRLNAFDIAGMGPISLVNDTAVQTFAVEVQVLYMFSDFMKITMTK